MRRLLFIYFRYPLYPAGSYFQEFLNKLAESIEQIYLIASHYPRGTFRKPGNLRIFWVPFFKMRFVEDGFFMLAALLRVMFVRELHKADLVNTIGSRGLLAGWYLKKIYRIPLVCTLEMLNERGSLVNNVYYEIVKFLMKTAPIDKIISWSNYYCEEHLKKWGVPEGKVRIIPAGIDTDIYNPGVDGKKIKKKYAPNCPLIVFAKPLYSTNTEAAKLLVRAVAFLKPEIRVKLLIGGGEGENDVYNLAKELRVMDLVDFMPTTPFPEIPKYIAAADLIVLPFVYAPTTSRSLLEAMAMGKPVITTKTGEIPNIVKNDKEALLVNPVGEEIAKAIEQIISNQTLSELLSRNAAALVNKKYSLSIIVDKDIEVYKEVFSSIKKLKIIRR